MSSKQHQDPPETSVRKPTITAPRIRKTRTVPWMEEPFNPTHGERSLWVAVITQAVMDALSRCRSTEALYHKHEAIRWLTGNSRDFVLVCMLAGFEPSYIRRKAKRAIVAPTPWRAEPGKGKRYHERKEYRRKLRQQKAEAEERARNGSTVIIGPWTAKEV